ncbi:MAG: hypothetical protein ACOCRX_10485 [Candidatus Woesearchaeota archaeon]
MKIDSKYYPYPVLSANSNDILNSKFEAEVKFEEGIFEEFEINVNFMLENPDLNNLIKNNKAKYGLRINCSDTRYREFLTTEKSKKSIILSADKLDGTVKISPFIIASENFNYLNKYFHEDYGSTSFKIEKGNVLAVAKPAKFSVYKKESTIFTIKPNQKQQDESINIEMENNIIVIRLSSENYDNYNLLDNNKNMQKILLSQVVIPALIYVLDKLMNDSEVISNYNNYQWFHVLKDKFKEKYEISITDENWADSLPSSPAVAQELIGNPLKDSLNKLVKLKE